MIIEFINNFAATMNANFVVGGRIKMVFLPGSGATLTSRLISAVGHASIPVDSLISALRDAKGALK